MTSLERHCARFMVVILFILGVAALAGCGFTDDQGFRDCIAARISCD